MPPKIPRASRRPPSLTAKPRREHAQRTGDIVIAWNACHLMLKAIFARMVGHTDMAFAMWEELSGDSQQRKVLITAARVKYLEVSDVRAELEWLHARLDRYSTIRNEFVHGPLGYDGLGRSMRPVVLPKNPGGKNRKLTSVDV